MSRLRIFDTDPDAKPQPRPTSDIVGFFRSGTQLDGRPVALSDWRITTADPALAETLRGMFGGDDPSEWDTSKDDKLELFTTTNSVEVILDGANAITTSMVLWGRSAMIRHCDGVEQFPDPDTGKREPCACPASFDDRKAAARKGTGCQPSIRVYFTLADAPELGKFRFQTGSWTLAKEVDQAQDALDRIGGPARATLRLDVITYVAKSGPNAGKVQSFTKPVIEVHGPAEEG